MAGVQTSMGDYLDALVINLKALPGLAGVTIASAWIDPGNGVERLIFESISNTIDWGAMGRRRLDESYVITGFVYAQRNGAGEAAIKAARDRTQAIFNELFEELRTSRGQGLLQVRSDDHVATVEMDQGITADNDRVCRITFTVVVKSVLTP